MRGESVGASSVIGMAAEVDFWGEAVPNWIAAASTAGALVAAVVAARWAKRAALATREQADAASDDVGIARAALALAERQETDTRAETARATRQAEERRLDAVAPDIFARVSPGSKVNGVDFGFDMRDGEGDWVLMREAREFKREQYTVMFRQAVVLTLENVSTVPARIDFVDPYRGELYDEHDRLLAGFPAWLMPGEAKRFTWRRVVALQALVDGGGTIDPFGHLFYLEFWARDVGQNVRTPYKFGGTVMQVQVDGSRIVVGPVPSHLWPDRVAFPLPRVYERLEAAEAE